MTLHVEGAGITHRGAVRDNNEDCIAIGYWMSQDTMDKARPFDYPLDLPFVCCVADGMGGHNDGEQASLLVARGLARRIPAFGPEKVGSSVRAVNAELYAHVAEHPALAGMGSTVVGLSIHGQKLTIFNVGDSRAYKITQKGLAQLSVDDSIVQNWKPGSSQPRSTVLTQCFGGRTSFTDVEPNLHVEPALADNVYLLCSDGLYETLTEEKMVSLISQDLTASAEALLKAAIDEKCRDNTTIALVRVVDKAPV